MASVADTFVKSGCSISTATESMNNTLKDLEKQYDAMSARIDAKMENYRAQFSRLDTMMAQMNSVSSYLTQQLYMLGNIEIGRASSKERVSIEMYNSVDARRLKKKRTKHHKPKTQKK